MATKFGDRPLIWGLITTSPAVIKYLAEVLHEGEVDDSIGCLCSCLSLDDVQRYLEARFDKWTVDRALVTIPADLSPHDMGLAQT
jgi:hypothetical protein